MFPCPLISPAANRCSKTLGAGSDLFDPAYIGGWTAAHHWELTEQLSNETVVFTTRRITRQGVTSQGARFLLRRVPTDRMFGLVTLWRGSTRVAISDAPAR